ncbi:HotDog domain-containing protein [Nemania serpens]|nr:HotDog domain-containing protein [Nemania serpens]
MTESPDLSYFESIPWCAALLRKPGIVTFTPIARQPAGPDGHFPSQDQLFKTSLNTDNTIPGYLGFYQSPFSHPTRFTLPPAPPAPSVPSTGAGPHFLVGTVSLLADLRPGVNGFNGTVHGGLIASLLDEAMGCLLVINAEVLRDMLANGATIPENVLNLTEVGPTMTATMNVRFMKPMFAPQVVMATATLTKAEGRKLVLSCDIKNDKGTEFVRGEGLWIIGRKDKL